jgi:hypothetical protein
LNDGLNPLREIFYATVNRCVEMGIYILSQPKKMYFGGTHFVGLDPDGHRLRVAIPD